MQIGKVEDTEIKSVSSLVSHISDFEKRHIAQWFFRGHSKSEYKLIPSLYRLKHVLDESFSNWDDLEEFLLLKFRREGAQYADTRELNKEDLLCLAQHHRLPTRLLDWATNPLIALYFAVESNYESDSDLWCMGYPSTNNCLSEGTFFSQRLDLVRDDFILFPHHIDSRIINQSGCFTVHDSDTPINEDISYEDILVFNKIVVPKCYKRIIRAELYDMGIHASFIYPSLDSLASKLMYELTETHHRKTCFKE